MSDHDVNKLILVTPSRRRATGDGASKPSGPSREDAAVITDGLAYFQQEHSQKAALPEVRPVQRQPRGVGSQGSGPRGLGL